MKMNIFASLPAIALMAACGGSSTGNLPTSFEGMSDELADKVALADDIDFTPKATVLANGNASYSGIAGYEIDFAGETSDLTSQMNVDVNLTSSTISGAMSNFVTEDEEAVSGSLSLSNGTVDSSGANVALAADIGGNLTGPDGETVVISGDLDGGIGGDDGQYLGATMEGDISIDGDAGTFEGFAILDR